ncbi:MAG: leucine-rich repeat domain-containing protein [Bacilli bacterium]|nr:leucine-rich repeat domain-containing protein [Bacilli bacterium]
MKILNKLLMITITAMSIGAIVSCGGADNSGDLTEQAESPQITILQGYFYEGHSVEFHCNDDATDLKVDWGDGSVNSEHTHTYQNEEPCMIIISGHITSLSLSDENGVYALGNNQVEGIMFSTTITNLPAYSFDVYSLRTVIIPDSVQNIGEYAFDRFESRVFFFISAEQKPQGWAETWSNIDSFMDVAIWGVKLGISNSYVYAMMKQNESNVAGTFLYDNNQTEITMPDAVIYGGVKYQVRFISIEDSIVETIHLPKYIRGFYNSFSRCDALKTIDYSRCQCLEYFGDNTFDSCHSLTEIFIPKTVKHIAIKSVYRCENISKITVEEGNPVYYSPSGYNVVMKDKTVVLGCKESKIPDGTKIIGDSAFYTSEIASISLPDSVEKIEGSAFNSCEQLKIINLSKNLQEIGPWAFAYSGLTQVTFNSELKKIDEYGFYYCSALKVIDVTKYTTADSIPICGYDAFYIYDEYAHKKVFQYSGALDNHLYFVDKGWPDNDTSQYHPIEWIKEGEI